MMKHNLFASDYEEIEKAIGIKVYQEVTGDGECICCITYKGVKIELFRFGDIDKTKPIWDGKSKVYPELCFSALYSNSEYGYLIRDTWDSDDEREYRELQPKARIRMNITKPRLTQWLEYALDRFLRMDEKYKAFRLRHARLQAECKERGGTWIHSRWAKEGDMLTPSMQDKYQIDGGWIKYEKTVCWENEYLTLKEHKLYEMNKYRLFKQAQEIVPVPKPKGVK